MKPWENEPNFAIWQDQYLCLIIRGPSRQLNGYVGIPPTHPLHGKPYSYQLPKSIAEPMLQRPIGNASPIDVFLASGGDEYAHRLSFALNVHGGLTFAGEWEEVFPEKDLWWFGFDCAHADDLCPGNPYSAGVYRDFPYVKNEVQKLAGQLYTLENQLRSTL